MTDAKYRLSGDDASTISDLMDHYDFRDPVVCEECAGLSATFNLNQLEALMRMFIDSGDMTPTARHVIRRLYDGPVAIVSP